MNITNIILVAFFSIIVIGLIHEIKVLTYDRNVIKKIKEAKQPKKEINKKTILIETNIQFMGFMIVSIIFILFAGVFILLLISKQNQSVSTLVPIIIFAIFLTTMPILSFISVYKIRKKIKNDEYYIEEAILSNKYTNTVDNTTYYFEFKDKDYSIKTNMLQYNISEVGDKFYIVIIDYVYYAYNTNIYNLEDESKIIKRI